MDKSEAIYHFTPITPQEAKKCESTGKNNFTIVVKKIYQICVVAYYRNANENKLKYSDGDIEFDYSHENNGIYYLIRPAINWFAVN